MYALAPSLCVYITNSAELLAEQEDIFMSRYDTVDDKVGAALTMVYVTGQPVVFVGCGQKYTHLRKLQVRCIQPPLVEARTKSRIPLLYIAKRCYPCRIRIDLE